MAPEVRMEVWVEVHIRGLFGAPEVSGVYKRFLIGPLLTSGASPMVPMYKQIALLRGNFV